MRKIAAFFLIFMLVLNFCYAQETIIKKATKDKYGFYNKTTHKWSDIWFVDYQPPLICPGETFYILEGENYSWGVVSSKNYNVWLIDNKFDHIRPWPSYVFFEKTMCFDVRIGNDNGLFDERGRELLPIRYEKILSWISEWSGDVYVRLSRNNIDSAIYVTNVVGDLLYVLRYFPGIDKPDSTDILDIPKEPMSKVVSTSLKDKSKHNKPDENIYWNGSYYTLSTINERNDGLDHIRYYQIPLKELKTNAVRKWVQEVKCFSKYAAAYRQSRIEEWQKKGEFEKLDDYNLRVSGERLQKKIEELNCEAKQLFIKDNLQFFDFRKSLTLGEYDSENEVFVLHSGRFGLLKIHVPFNEAPIFKENFKAENISNEEYFVNADTFDIASFNIDLDGKTYMYSSNNNLDYSLDQNKIITLDQSDINIVTEDSHRGVKKPKVQVISPETGSYYYQSVVSFRICIIPGIGHNHRLFVEINGADKMELQPVDQQDKGAKVMEGHLYELTLPTVPGRIVNLAFTAVDEQNISSETRKTCLIYAGQVVKPKLILFAVGVGDYTSGDINKLHYAAKDARDFVSTVENANLDDYTELVKHVYIDRDATRKNITSGLRSLMDEVRQDDVVMLYFSGHGVQDGSETYFMTVNASSENPDDEAVSFSSLRNSIKKLIDRQVKVVVFMDACHAGAMIGTKGAAPALTELNVENAIEFYSCTRGEKSAEDEKLGNGVFTSALISGINGAAADPNGYITFNTLRLHVVNYVREYNRHQTPVSKGVDAGDITLFRKK